MTQLGEPFTKEEIIEALTAEFSTVHDFFTNIAQGDFFVAPPEVWSAADNLVHLIKSCKPVVKGLNVPKVALRMRFGTATYPSRTFATVRQVYIAALNEGTAVASGSYLPEVTEKTAVERDRILHKWQSVGSEFVDALNDWSENDLDKYAFPHPILGEMTVREILFFTLYHNMHHVNDVQRLLSLPVSEWFVSLSDAQ